MDLRKAAMLVKSFSTLKKRLIQLITTYFWKNFNTMEPEEVHIPSRYIMSFQRLEDVYTTSLTSYRRLIDVEATPCVYGVISLLLNSKKQFVSTAGFNQDFCG